MKMPTEISHKWWITNVPSSLPKSKKLEENLKLAEKTTVVTAIKAFQKFKTDGAQSLDLESIAGVPQYKVLEEELTKFKILANKDKASHHEFVEGVTLLAKFVKKQRAEVGDALRTLEEAGAMKRHRNVAQDLEEVESDFATGYAVKVERAKKQLAAIMNNIGGFTAEDLEELALAIGRSRFVQTAMKTEREKMKRDADKWKDQLAESREINKLVQDTIAGAKAQIEMGVVVDKALLQKCVALIGDEKGKKLFLKAPAQKVSL
jgi:hypothetical protein